MTDHAREQDEPEQQQPVDAVDGAEIVAVTSDHGRTTTHAPMNTAASSDHEWTSVSRMRLPSTK